MQACGAVPFVAAPAPEPPIFFTASELAPAPIHLLHAWVSWGLIRPAVVFVIIGALLTNIIPQKEIELVMNIVLVLLSVFLIFNTEKKLEQSNKNLIVGGVSSGFLAGLVGTGGAIRGLVLAAFSLEKDSFLATSALIDLGVDFSRAIVYISSGYFLKEFLIFIPFLILISIAGSYIVKLVLNKMPQTYFRNIVLIVIVSISIYSISKYF
jgi:uncharacterized membrane protein YfcA